MWPTVERRSMRLLFLNHNLRFNGTYYRAMPMAEQLAQRGHQVTLLTVSRTRRWTADWSTVNGVRLGEMPNLARRYEGYGPLDVLTRIWHAMHQRYDLIQMFDHKPNATFPGLAARWRRVKLVADWADWWGGDSGVNATGHRVPLVARFEDRWETQSKLWADGVVTISTVLQQRAIELGVKADRVLYLPTGAALQRIQPIALEAARVQLGVPLDRFIIGFIGLGQGDLEIVMQAQAQLPDVWLMVIGAKQASVSDLARSFGVADRLWQTDRVPDEAVGAYLACANVMCLPLRATDANRGRLPNKLLDYLAAGRPVVASPIGDAKTIVEQYHVGLLAVDDFARALERLKADRALCDDLGRQARHTAETVFAWPSLIDRLEAFYQNLLMPSGQGDPR
ncbi:MAG: glycosyltransferase family 4 protein [Anaerolineae bacterium]